jgi:hypothetical protein
MPSFPASSRIAPVRRREAPREPAALAHVRGPSRARLASRVALAAGALGAFGALMLSACVPTPFTFDETNGAGGAATTMSQSSATTSTVSSTTTSASSTASGSGGAPSLCALGFDCVEAVPPGWTDHALIYVSQAGGPMPTCPNGDKSEKLSGEPTTSQHTCSACSCTLSGALCSAPTITCYHLSSTCNSADTFMVQATNNGCVVDPTAPILEDQPGSCRLTGDPVPLANGTCMKTGGTPITPEDWGIDVHTCPAMKDTSCADGATCIQSPPADAQLCIWRLGEDPCPPEWPNRTVGYSGEQDTRGCTNCACGPTTCTGGQYTAIDDAACDAAAANKAVINSTNCTTADLIFDGASASLQPMLAAVDPVSCSGGAPIGEFKPLNPRVFCCK